MFRQTSYAESLRQEIKRSHLGFPDWFVFGTMKKSRKWGHDATKASWWTYRNRWNLRSCASLSWFWGYTTQWQHMPLIQADLPCPGMLFCGHGFSIFQALQIVIKKKGYPRTFGEHIWHAWYSSSKESRLKIIDFPSIFLKMSFRNAWKTVGAFTKPHSMTKYS